MTPTFRREYFQRRRYVVEGERLDRAKTIELIVKIDGKAVVHVHSREPGVVSVVSKVDAQGFEIDIAELRAFKYTDLQLPEGADVGAVADWQFEALGL